MSTTEMGPAFFLAAAVILTACRLVSRLLRPLGQPPVVGEMVAGVALGPSVLGLLSPGLEKAVFPDEIRPVLYVAGQVGLVVFMFLSGYEFRTDGLRSVGRTAVPVSAAGIAVPLLLGAGLAWAAHDTVDLYPDGISPTVGALFVGVTVAITAFPMMARIITERGLTNTRFGSVSLAAGALDDAVAWVLLAGVLSMAGSGADTFLRAVIGTAGLAVLLGVFLRVRPRALERARRLTEDHMLLVTVLLLFLAAWYTDRIGLYAVFGAFSLGVAFPRDPVVTRAVEAVAPVSRIVFLPLFFAYSGLNTDFTLLSDGRLLLFTVACVAVAIISVRCVLGRGAPAGRAAGRRRPRRHADERARSDAAHRHQRGPFRGHRLSRPLRRPGDRRPGDHGDDGPAAGPAGPPGPEPAAARSPPGGDDTDGERTVTSSGAMPAPRPPPPPDRALRPVDRAAAHPRRRRTARPPVHV